MNRIASAYVINANHARLLVSRAARNARGLRSRPHLRACEIASLRDTRSPIPPVLLPSSLTRTPARARSLFPALCTVSVVRALARTHTGGLRPAGPGPAVSRRQPHRPRLPRRHPPVPRPSPSRPARIFPRSIIRRPGGPIPHDPAVRPPTRADTGPPTLLPPTPPSCFS